VPKSAKAPSRVPGAIGARRKRVAASASGFHDPAYEVTISSLWEAAPPYRAAPTTGSAHWARDAALRRSLAFADVFAIYMALILALILVSSGSVHLRPTDALLAPFIVAAAKAIGLYDRDQHILRKTTIDEVPSLVYLSVLYSLTVWLAEALLFHGFLDRPQVFALTLLSFVFLTLGRWLARAVTGALRPPERCVVVGSGVDTARIAAKLEGSPGVNADIVARLSLYPDEPGRTARFSPGGPLGGVGELAHLIADHQVERVIIAPDGHDQDEIIHGIRLIKALGVKVSVLPRLLEVVGSSSTFEDVDGLTLLGVRQHGASRSSEALKRLMDLVGAVIVVVLFAPLMLLLAVAIKLDSRGPVLFRQRRIGRKGEGFWMFKFRSMVKNAEETKMELSARNEAEGGLFKIAEDPRITHVGRLLRRTSLDELPQLLNVLVGHMSLVGPRPLVQDEDALIEGWQRRRLAVKPGMTGMWQIYGSSRIPMDEMVKIDYLYGANWSLWLDLKVLLRTVPYVLRRRGL